MKEDDVLAVIDGRLLSGRPSMTASTSSSFMMNYSWRSILMAGVLAERDPIAGFDIEADSDAVASGDGACRGFSFAVSGMMIRPSGCSSAVTITSRLARYSRNRA